MFNIDLLTELAGIQKKFADINLEIARGVISGKIQVHSACGQKIEVPFQILIPEDPFKAPAVVITDDTIQHKNIKDGQLIYKWFPRMRLATIIELLQNMLLESPPWRRTDPPPVFVRDHHNIRINYSALAKIIREILENAPSQKMSLNTLLQIVREKVLAGYLITFHDIKKALSLCKQNISIFTVGKTQYLAVKKRS